MKQRPEPVPERDAEASLKALSKALAALDRAEDVRAFLEDLCTPAELEAMADRWRVVPLLLKGVPYRDIHERTRVSVTTIGRVARTLEHGAGGYAKAAQRQFPSLASH
jgi:TrpR-related protein YerC/YecD